MIINQSAYIVINHLKFLIKISFLRLRLKGKKRGSGEGREKAGGEGGVVKKGNGIRERG